MEVSVAAADLSCDLARVKQFCNRRKLRKRLDRYAFDLVCAKRGTRPNQIRIVVADRLLYRRTTVSVMDDLSAQVKPHDDIGQVTH